MLDVLDGALLLIDLVDFLVAPVRWGRRVRRFAAKRRLRRMGRRTYAGDPLPCPSSASRSRSSPARRKTVHSSIGRAPSEW